MNKKYTISIFTTLFLILLVLKLFSNIYLPWIIVFAPLWGPPVIFILTIFVVSLLITCRYMTDWIFEHLKNWK